ncbi:MAG: hypothetical protein K2H86_08870 [Muribaculaceae bacterium]|nr:hypothetical protein [Muribaculaceae bacterium]
MISNEVIQEIYKNNTKPPKHLEDLGLFDALDLLKANHHITIDSDELKPTTEIIIEDLEESNPFRRFLLRSLYAVLEFDKMVAFVFRNHILFLGKKDKELRVHFKPEPDPEPRGNIFSRIFGGR